MYHKLDNLVTHKNTQMYKNNFKNKNQKYHIYETEISQELNR